MISFVLAFMRFIRAIILSFKNPETKGLVVSAIALLLIGTIFYSTVEHWSILNAVYFSITTLTTTGFGDLAPKSDAGKIFTIFYLLVGVGVFVGFVATIADQDRLGRKRKN